MPKQESLRAFSLVAIVLVSLSFLERLGAQGQAEPGAGKLQVDVVPFSHLDLFWAGTREEDLARGNRIIAKAIQIAKQHPEFRFYLEDETFVANYVESHAGSPELEELKRLVKEGQIEIGSKWAGTFQNLPNGEVHARNLLYGKRYARSVFGVDPQVSHPGDLPGFVPQFPQMLKQAGIPYMVMTRMGPPDKSLFDWKSPDGSKVLVWNTIRGYGWGVHLNLHGDLDEQRIKTLQKELEEVRTTAPGPVYVPWGVDLWAPSERLVENVSLLNRSLPSTHFALATPLEFFQRVAKTPNLPELSGEIPSAWPHVVTSIVHLWQLAVPATNTLQSAEKFAAINYALGYADYPQQEFDFLWKRLIESMDHNHDGQGGEIGDQRKMEYSRLAILRGGEILRDMLRNIAERVEIPIARSFPIVVFNPLGWPRSDLVKAHVTLYGDVGPYQIDEYKKGMNLVDEKGSAIPFYVTQTSDNISRALELMFVAQGVPSLGYKTYYLVPAERPEAFANVAEISLDRDKDLKEPRRPLGADVMENAFYRVTVDKASGRVAVFDKVLNREVAKDLEIVAVEERGTNNVSAELVTGRTIPASINEMELEENNPIRTVMKISGQIADIPVVQRLTLYRGLKRLDIENRIEWKGPRFINIVQRFPLQQSGVEIHYGVPFGECAASNIMPNTGPHAPDEIQRNAWERYRQIQDWVFAGTSDWGLTLAADHQLMWLEGSEVRGDMIRGQRYTSVRIVRDGKVTSITDYPPPGSYVFKYSLTSGPGDWKVARSYRFGMDFNNGLVPVSVADEISRKTLPPSRSFCSLRGENLVMSALKKSDLDGSILLRLYEIQGAQAETPIEFLGQQVGFREANLLEEEIRPNEERILRLNPYEIKTVKLGVRK